ncbi:MAG: hypothetical protein QM783_16200 [Phycisphaerales bacterium]
MTQAGYIERTLDGAAGLLLLLEHLGEVFEGGGQVAALLAGADGLDVDLREDARVGGHGVGDGLAGGDARGDVLGDSGDGGVGFRFGDGCEAFADGDACGDENRELAGELSELLEADLPALGATAAAAAEFSQREGREAHRGELAVDLRLGLARGSAVLAAAGGVDGAVLVGEGRRGGEAHADFLRCVGAIAPATSAS